MIVLVRSLHANAFKNWLELDDMPVNLNTLDTYRNHIEVILHTITFLFIIGFAPNYGSEEDHSSLRNLLGPRAVEETCAVPWGSEDRFVSCSLGCSVRKV